LLHTRSIVAKYRDIIMPKNGKFAESIYKMIILQN